MNFFINGKLSFYSLYWKRDRDILLPYFIKIFIFFIFSIILAALVYYYYIYERRSFFKVHSQVQKLQHDLIELRENQTLYLKNKNKIKIIKLRNFVGSKEEVYNMKIWAAVVSRIQNPAKNEYDINNTEMLKAIGTRTGYNLMTSELKMHAFFWHENELLSFLESLNNLPGAIRERECLVTRSKREISLSAGSNENKPWQPVLEAKCVLGLFWAQ